MSGPEVACRETGERYSWGSSCLGWHLVKGEALSVIEEQMPPGTREQMHSHKVSRQFFYLLEGEGTMRFQTGKAVFLLPGQGLEIPPGVFHQMCNDSGKHISFLVVSAPKAHGDRVTAE